MRVVAGRAVFSRDRSMNRLFRVLWLMTHIAEIRTRLGQGYRQIARMLRGFISRFLRDLMTSRAPVLDRRMRELEFAEC